MATRIVRKITDRIAARTAGGRQVVIEEVTEFQHITMLDGRVVVAEGVKAHRIGPGEPVNRDNAGFTLARTGERIDVL